jgi:hypothetical protein
MPSPFITSSAVHSTDQLDLLRPSEWVNFIDPARGGPGLFSTQAHVAHAVDVAFALIGALDVLFNGLGTR